MSKLDTKAARALADAAGGAAQPGSSYDYIAGRLVPALCDRVEELERERDQWQARAKVMEAAAAVRMGAFQCGTCGGYVASNDLAAPCPHCELDAAITEVDRLRDLLWLVHDGAEFDEGRGALLMDRIGKAIDAAKGVL